MLVSPNKASLFSWHLSPITHADRQSKKPSASSNNNDFSRLLLVKSPEVVVSVKAMKTDFAPFLAWCQARGVTTPLELVNNGGYRYMALPNNKDQLFQQSKSPGLINVVTAPLEACIVGEDWETLVAKLQYEKSKGMDSAYSPWLDLFPTQQDLHDMPRFWKEERRELVRTFDSGQLEARMGIDQLRFQQVQDPWALAIVDSRSNFLPDNTYAITPMLDMFNHKSTIRTSARVDGGNRFLLEVDSNSILETDNQNSQPANDWTKQLFSFFGGKNSKQDEYTSGKEVFVSYGNFDNMETLCNYGFVDEDNTANMETFRVRLLGKAPAYMLVDSSGSIDNMLNQLSLADLRVALATPEEMKWLEENWDGMSKISDKNNVEVFALIAGELEEALYDARNGAEQAHAMGDALVANYLRGRQKTLEKGRDWLKTNYPNVF